MYYFIEPMLEEDIPAVQQIERASFSTPWSPNTYRRELRSPATSRYIVARASASLPPPRTSTAPPRKGLLETLLPGLFNAAPPPSPFMIVGYGGIWLTLEEAHITTIAVSQAHRGFGVGELLLNGLIDAAITMQARWLTLEVRVSNEPAQRLYHKYGFEVKGHRPRYYTDNGEDALIMSTDSIDTSTYQAMLKELRARLYERLRLQGPLARPLRRDYPA